VGLAARETGGLQVPGADPSRTETWRRDHFFDGKEKGADVGNQQQRPPTKQARKRI
jgi:hypothetical protein